MTSLIHEDKSNKQINQEYCIPFYTNKDRIELYKIHKNIVSYHMVIDICYYPLKDNNRTTNHFH